MKPKLKKRSEVKLEDALDNLTLLAAIDPNNPYLLGIQGNRFVIQSEEHNKANWLVSQEGSEFLQLVQASYQAILTYFLDLYENKEIVWEDPKTRKGVQGIMEVCGEGAKKCDRILQRLQGAWQSIFDVPEYQQLQSFYLDKLMKKFSIPLEGEKAWEGEFHQGYESQILDTEHTGLKDFETVKNDKEYELFYLVTDSGKPYFHPTLFRNIKLVCDFDARGNLPLEEDPLLRIRTMQDRDLFSAAMQIFEIGKPWIQKFYKERVRQKKMVIIQGLARALMALMLAKNSKNLLQNTSEKSSLSYFQDVQWFLKMALQSPEYQKWVAYPPSENDKLAHLLLDLTHILCKGLFTRKLGIQQEMDGFIHRLIRKGEELIVKEKEFPLFSKQSSFNQFVVEHEAIRKILGHYPSGPLFKTLDLIREEKILGFEPLMQGNFPYRLYTIEETFFLHLPSPTRQEVVAVAEISEEFLGYLRSLFMEKPIRRHLLIHLQEADVWQDSGRALAIDRLQKQAEFTKCLTIIHLPKNGDFYYQKGGYISMERASEFMEALAGIVRDLESVIKPFTKKIIPKIHEVVFQGKKNLTREERLDFIEIFYAFITLKLLEELHPYSMSFTCKDGLDAGGAFAAAFYAFTFLTRGKTLDKKIADSLRLIFYTSALLVRERAIDVQRFHRVLSFLAKLEELPREELEKMLRQV